MFTFGDRPLIDPVTLRADCERTGLPWSDWWGRPNQWTNPLGTAPGTGWILLSRASLNALSLNTLYDLKLGTLAGEVAGLGAGSAHTATHKSLLIVAAVCVTPGRRGDPDAAYLCELADRRRLYRPIPIDRAYNVRSQPGGSSYFSATLNAGVAWTWAQMVSDVWSAVGSSRLGAFPGLPFTPDGTPEGFSFYGSYALDALGVVLDRLGCALSLDTQADTFGIVRLGAADATREAALAAEDQYAVWDDDPLESDRARLPERVRVLFPKSRATPDTTGGSPWYAVDEADPTAGGATPGTEAGTYDLLYDDLAAVYNATGALTNAAALATRAAERAADHFRRVRAGRLRRVYGLPLDDAGLRPGALVGSVRHGDRGRGLVTEAGRAAERPGGDPLASLALLLYQQLSAFGPVYGSGQGVTYEAGAQETFLLGSVLNMYGELIFKPGSTIHWPFFDYIDLITNVCPIKTGANVTDVKIERTRLYLPPFLRSPHVQGCITSPADCCAAGPGSGDGTPDPCVHSCDQCPLGAPLRWNFTAAGFTGAKFHFNGAFDLTYASGCCWDYQDDNVQWTLCYTSGVEGWELTGVDTATGEQQVTYVLGRDSWQCLGVNIMALDFENGTGAVADTVTLSPVSNDCGTGPPVSLPCCPDGVAQTLFCTISNATGDCACLEGTYEIGWNPDSGRWEGAINACTGATTTISLYCGGETAADWFFELNGSCPAHPGNPTAFSCDPLMLEWTATTIDGPGCCTEGAPFDITVTDVV